MPIYEYKCPECGRVEEHIEPMLPDAPMPYPVCYHGAIRYSMRRIISTPAPAQFKGSGFYVNDYKEKK